MQEVEFETSGNMIHSIEEMEYYEKEFRQIVKILVKNLNWKLVQRIEADVLLYDFRKNKIEISLAYNDMPGGMFLRTEDEAFDMEALFSEINEIMKQENKGIDKMKPKL